jgi:hypothetical protein
MGLMVEWKSGTLQFESHILCNLVQLSLAVAVSEGGTVGYTDFCPKTLNISFFFILQLHPFFN